MWGVRGYSTGIWDHGLGIEDWDSELGIRDWGSRTTTVQKVAVIPRLARVLTEMCSGSEAGSCQRLR